MVLFDPGAGRQYQSSEMKLDVIPSKDPWYADGLSFTCTCCGNCCTGGPGYVWMSDAEIDRLAGYFKGSREAVIDEYCRAIGDKFSLKENVRQGNYDCVFLREEKVERREGDETVVVHTK